MSRHLVPNDFAALLIAAILAALSMVAGHAHAERRSGSDEMPPTIGADLITGPAYFDETTIDRVVPRHMEVWRLAKPLAGDQPQAGYTQYPVSVTISQFMQAINASTASKTTSAWLVWDNRCNKCADGWSRKPNSYGSILQVTASSKGYVDFDDRAKAQAGTLARVLFALNYPAHAKHPCAAGQKWCGYLDATEAAGIPDTLVVHYADVAANPAAYFTVGPNADNQLTAMNLVVLPPVTLNGNAKWVNCDCESADNTAASSKLAFLREMAAEVHHAPIPRKLAVSPDAYQGAGKPGGFCGIGAVWRSCDRSNLAEIAEAVDLLYIPTAGPPAKGFNYTSQLADSLKMLGSAPSSHLMLQFAMGVWPKATTVADATTAKTVMASRGITHVMISPVFSQPGGDQCRWSNYKIEELLGLSHGTCARPRP